MLTPEIVTTLRQAAVKLQELNNTKIETTDTAQERVTAERVLIDAMMQPELVLEFVAAWYTCHFEYIPLVKALDPIFQRSVQLHQAKVAMQRAQAQAQAAAKAAAPVADSPSVGTT